MKLNIWRKLVNNIKKQENLQHVKVIFSRNRHTKTAAAYYAPFTATIVLYKAKNKGVMGENIAHEFAHAYIHNRYGNISRKKAHGKLFQNVLFKLTKRYFNLPKGCGDRKLRNRIRLDAEWDQKIFDNKQ